MADNKQTNLQACLQCTTQTENALTPIRRVDGQYKVMTYLGMKQLQNWFVNTNTDSAEKQYMALLDLTNYKALGQNLVYHLPRMELVEEFFHATDGKPKVAICRNLFFSETVKLAQLRIKNC